MNYETYIKRIIDASKHDRDYMVMLARCWARKKRGATPAEIQRVIASFNPGD